MKEKRSKLKRKLHINNEEWRWQVGKGFYVYVQPPSQDKVIKIMWKDLDLDEDDLQWLERYCCRDCSGRVSFSITPSLVKDYIENTLLQNREE